MIYTLIIGFVLIIFSIMRMSSILSREEERNGHTDS